MIAGLVAALPLLPDGDEARRWADDELADPVYRAAEPTLIDRVSAAIARFIGDLFDPSAPASWGPPALVVLAIVIVGAAVIALLIWGRPRTTPRAHPEAPLLFDLDDGRTADQLRTDAEAEARRGAWDAAVVLRFRAIARGLVERGLVETPPGATVHAFSRAAARALPPLAAAFDDAAVVFDDVRYLRRPGTAEHYRRLVSLDDEAVRTRARMPDATAVTP